MLTSVVQMGTLEQGMNLRKILVNLRMEKLVSKAVGVFILVVRGSILNQLITTVLGIRIKEETLVFDPVLPKELSRV